MAESPFSRRDACGGVDCPRTERHQHTGDLVVGERVVLVPHSHGAAGPCWRHAHAVVVAVLDGIGYRVRLDDDGAELDVPTRDAVRARTWRPPAPKKEVAAPPATRSDHRRRRARPVRRRLVTGENDPVTARPTTEREAAIERIIATGKTRKQATAFLDILGSAFRRRGWINGEPLDQAQIKERVNTFLDLDDA